MSRIAIKKDDIRTLFAKTGNQCAFPGCRHRLVDDDGTFIAQICHITAAAAGGERYDETLTDEQRAHPTNLIVLCYEHHIKTNNTAVYTVDVLFKMKEDHESRFSGVGYTLSEDSVDKIFEEELM